MTSNNPSLQPLGQPSKPSTTLAKPHLSPTSMLHLTLPNQPHSSAQPFQVQLISSHPTVFKNSFDNRSLTLDNEEDNIQALMTFSSSPTTTVPLHVSTAPQHIITKHQKHKIFHSKPKSYAPLTKQPSATAGMRSSHSSMEKQLSPMATTNGMVFNSYLQKNYGRNH